jgi:hypothetical protein
MPAMTACSSKTFQIYIRKNWQSICQNKNGQGEVSIQAALPILSTENNDTKLLDQVFTWKSWFDSELEGFYRVNSLLFYICKDVSKLGFDEELAKQWTAAGSEAAASPCNNLITSMTSSK